MRIIVLCDVILVILTFSVITNIYAQEDNNTTLEKTLYFQVEIPDDWIYEKYSNSYVTKLLGFGPSNTIDAMPSEYWGVGENTTYAVAQFKQEVYYSIKNAPLDTYVNTFLNVQPSMKVISQKNVTLADETSREIYAEGIGKQIGYKYLHYYLIHDKEPYFLGYKASNHLFEKYLPDFQKMVKSFKWIN